MYLDRLEYKKDLLRGFDGRCRIISGVFLIAALVHSTEPALLAAAMALCLAVLCRELRVTFLRLLPVNIMAIALWAPVIVTSNGWSAFVYTLRINSAALLYMCFIIPMGISVTASSLSKLKVPTKLVSLFILTYRYIFLLHDRFWTAQKSMRLRGAVYRRGAVHTDVAVWRSLAAVFASSVVGAIGRGHRVWTAMLARGFAGSFPVVVAFRWRLRDTVLLSASMACAIFIALWRG
jgi:cobalt/nickel transport system permease protein